MKVKRVLVKKGETTGNQVQFDYTLVVLRIVLIIPLRRIYYTH